LLALKGVPVSVAPIIAADKVIAALGVVDVVGTIDLPDVFGARSQRRSQAVEFPKWIKPSEWENTIRAKGRYSTSLSFNWL
jgi:hypothetical protein